MDYFRYIQRWFIGMLWPSRCLGCRTLDFDICSSCLRGITPLRVQRCPICRRPSATGATCSGCRASAHIDRIIAAAQMEGLIEQAIYALKYRGMHQVATPLGDWMAHTAGVHRETALMFGSNPLIVPVPLHPSRLRERDYNQAALLARRIAIASAMPLEESALIRVRRTGSQVKTHTRTERLDNMRGAFETPRTASVADRDIVLVDDVCTTGATLEDCARALKEAGARSVSAIVLAHG